MPEAKRAVIFINGEVRRHEWIPARLRNDDYLIAVDGGYRHMKAAGLTPRQLTGDQDSIDPRDVKTLAAAGVEIQTYPFEKDETDLEIALLTAQKHGFKVVRVIGAFGGRMDHWLANLYLLLNPAFADMDIRFIDEDLSAFVIRTSAGVEGQAGDLLSLIPMGADVKGVTTEGLKYPLRGETLYVYKSRGVSNVMSGAHARVSITGGALLCILQHTQAP